MSGRNLSPVTNDPNDPNGSNGSNGSKLLKPLRSGGGHRVRPWRGGRVPRGCYLQERIDGTPGSVVFLAAGGDVAPLAISRQIVGDASFGATGYRYCGNIIAAAGDPQSGGDALVAAACTLARAVAAEFRLVGVNGIDFIARQGVPYTIEVNPRWSASMELADLVSPIALFAAHARACLDAAIATPRFGSVSPPRRALGKAVVFARRNAVIADSRPWLDDPAIHDVPHPGERFAPGQPVCTVLAEAVDAQACYDALVARAARVYAALDNTLTPRAGLVESVRT